MYYQFSDNEFGDIYNKAEKTVKLLRLSKYEEQVIKEVERIDNCRSEINQSRLFYERLVKSIHNAQWKAKSQDSFWRKKEAIYNEALFHYDPIKVANAYTDHSQLFNKGLINSPKKIEGIWQAAIFINELESKYSGVRKYFDKYANDKIPASILWGVVNSISVEVRCIGVALACDFLKEMGYYSFSKPDVHIKRIFGRIGLLPKHLNIKDEDYYTFCTISKMSEVTGETAFKIDKVFWLMGSQEICPIKPIKENCAKCHLAERCTECSKRF